MGERAGLGKPIQKDDGARMIGYTGKNQGTELDRAKELPIRAALACAALEAGLEPIK
jgi:hypothetical protein